ncbi:MAG: metallophosphoesterase family protein [Nannocystaceae bacterium]|nr:metallophosphoesterase family protein [Myxococcales bacterium]
MRIAAISDLHIGPRARGDAFGHREDAFLERLDALEAAHDRIVLVGDVFQTEHGVALSRRVAARELARARARLPRLAARLAGYDYVHGNHDEVSRVELAAPSELRVEADGFAVLFVHGHQFDPVLRRVAPLARAATWATGRMRAAGLAPLADWFEGRDIQIKHDRFGRADGPYASACRGLLARHGVDAVVMGHTHVPVRYEFPEGVVINTGSCSRGAWMYASIDTRARIAAIVGE